MKRMLQFIADVVSNNIGRLILIILALGVLGMFRIASIERSRDAATSQQVAEQDTWLVVEQHYGVARCWMMNGTWINHGTGAFSWLDGNTPRTIGAPATTARVINGNVAAAARQLNIDADLCVDASVLDAVQRLIVSNQSLRPETGR